MDDKASGRRQGKASGALNNGVQRGTQNELEVLGLIIMQNSTLRQSVFDRLRQAKARYTVRQDALKARGGVDDQAG